MRTTSSRKLADLLDLLSDRQLISFVTVENGFQVVGGSTNRLGCSLKSIKKLNWGKGYNIYAILAKIHNLESTRYNRSTFFSTIAEDQDVQTYSLV